MASTTEKGTWRAHSDARVRPVTVIEPLSTSGRERLRELWRSRRLLRYFSKRAMEKVYTRTALGAVWLFLRPVLDVGTKVVIFGLLLGAPSNGIPYALFLLVGMTAWHLFDRSLFWATRSLELNRKLIQRMYFPRMIVPIATTAPAAIELLVYLAFTVILAVCFAIFDGTPYVDIGPGLLEAVLALALIALLSIGLGLWTSVLGAATRDLRYSLRYVLDFWMFMTPVIYPLSSLGEPYRTLMLANPMAPLVELYKRGVLGMGTVDPLGLGISVAVVIGALCSGVWFFSRAESVSVDAM